MSQNNTIISLGDETGLLYPTKPQTTRTMAPSGVAASLPSTDVSQLTVGKLSCHIRGSRCDAKVKVIDKVNCELYRFMVELKLRV